MPRVFHVAEVRSIKRLLVHDWQGNVWKDVDRGRQHRTIERTRADSRNQARGNSFYRCATDRTTSEHLLKPVLQDPDLRVVQICKEDEGVSICSGLYAAGQRALLLMQHTGWDSLNALRGIAVEGKNPVCMMVGLLNREARCATYPVQALWDQSSGTGLGRHADCAPPD